MVTIKQEPGAWPAAQAAANASSTKRKRASARLQEEAGGSIAGAGAAAVAIKAEAASAAVRKSEGDDGGADVDAGMFGKLKFSWASLDRTSTATEESPCTSPCCLTHVWLLESIHPCGACRGIDTCPYNLFDIFIQTPSSRGRILSNASS